MTSESRNSAVREARYRGSEYTLKIEELFESSISVQSVLYQRKVGDLLFPEPRVSLLSLFKK
jgi:hypothetical protein